MMKVGTWYIGDLCYVMHDEWDEVCELLFAGRDDYGCNQGEFTLKDGTRFAIYNTMYGDGAYYDQEGRYYPVDAGSIGCILLNDIDVDNSENDIGGGNVHSFNQDFYTGSQDGKIMIHNVCINTADEEEYEY